jgi:hypothetical protein
MLSRPIPGSYSTLGLSFPSGSVSVSSLVSTSVHEEVSLRCVR